MKCPHAVWRPKLLHGARHHPHLLRREQDHHGPRWQGQHRRPVGVERIHRGLLHERVTV